MNRFAACQTGIEFIIPGLVFRHLFKIIKSHPINLYTAVFCIDLSLSTEQSTKTPEMN
ncbi:hypothetical protein [Endozoicomonas lisbonensis]|uniref:Uncharacterized protein n=1 Tax=Endozoicomonas lisbonensis TaxID=3120522 RepID=A0ABV2SLT4_9GAMM